jgi:hypothetical protein
MKGSDMSETVIFLLLAAGLVSIMFGVAMVSPALALVAGGVLMVRVALRVTHED